MSAKAKKRLLKLENKSIKLETLQLKDVACSICQSILIEPVTLPCNHYFCQRCFNGSVENNALCCPLCRLRIGSWLRTTAKQNNLVNVELWDYIKTKFPKEIDMKLKGEDLVLPEDKPVPRRLSAPGEIRSEYEAELRRLKAERLNLEEKHMQQTELLIKKIQEEEREAQKQYMERLKQDEMLAKQLLHQEEAAKPAKVRQVKVVKSVKQLRNSTMDSFLFRKPVSVQHHPDVNVRRSSELADSSTSDLRPDHSTSDSNTLLLHSRSSPEIVPTYTKHIKNVIDQKLKTGVNCWNKENGEQERVKDKFNTNEERMETPSQKTPETKSFKEITKGVMKSLLVSLPLPQSGILQHKTNIGNKHTKLKESVKESILEKSKAETEICRDKEETLEKPEETITNKETGSVDSMRLELCYFKPIERTSMTAGVKHDKSLPLRVPTIRAITTTKSAPPVASSRRSPLSRSQYIEGLCKLRCISLSMNHPSAFVALNMLKSKQASTSKADTVNMSDGEPIPRNTSSIKPPSKKHTVRSRQSCHVNSGLKRDCKLFDTNLRRTRSMGSIKDENETTPKKAKIQDRKVVSERKPRLRSDTKKVDAKKSLSPTITRTTNNNNKIELAVKNLSSPLKNCDVKKILEEQLRIEKLIGQEKTDLELALKLDAEWNGRRLRRAPSKRQVTLNYALRSPKKVKV